MKKIEIKKYLNFLGMDGIEKMDFKSCEICENKNTKLIKSKISWNNNRYGILPVHCCLNCGFIFRIQDLIKIFILGIMVNLMVKKLF